MAVRFANTEGIVICFFFSFSLQTIAKVSFSEASLSR